MRLTHLAIIFFLNFYYHTVLSVFIFIDYKLERSSAHLIHLFLFKTLTVVPIPINSPISAFSRSFCLHLNLFEIMNDKMI